MKAKRYLNERGSIGNIIILVLILGIFVYFFISNAEKNNYEDISAEESESFLNTGIAAMSSLQSIKQGLIDIGPGQSKDLKNKNFIISINRGKDFNDGEKTLRCYLVHTADELEPRKGIQFLVLGVPEEAGGYSYHIVSFRKKSLKG